MEVIQFDSIGFLLQIHRVHSLSIIIKHWLHLDEINHVRKQVPWSFMKYNQVSVKYLLKMPCLSSMRCLFFFTGFYTKKKKKKKNLSQPMANDKKNRRNI